MSFNKFHKIKLKNNSSFILYKNLNNFYKNFDYLLISKDSSYLTMNQYDSIQKLILKFKKKNNSFFFSFIKPFFFLTKKPLESRMGGGKGNISFKIFPIKKGQIIFGVKNTSSLDLYKIFSLISFQLSFKLVLLKIKY